MDASMPLPIRLALVFLVVNVNIAWSDQRRRLGDIAKVAPKSQ
jgi:hypothetical protein